MADRSAERSRKPEGAGERGEVSRVRDAAAMCGKTLKGSKPHGRRCVAGVVSRGTMGDMAAASSEDSEGEYEPKRGALFISLDLDKDRSFVKTSKPSLSGQRARRERLTNVSASEDREKLCRAMRLHERWAWSGNGFGNIEPVA
jgi:hypothetical protein